MRFRLTRSAISNTKNPYQESAWEEAVQDFLIAQSAKDCSIMISMALVSADVTLEASSDLRTVHCSDPPCVIVYRAALVIR